MRYQKKKKSHTHYNCKQKNTPDFGPRGIIRKAPNNKATITATIAITISQRRVFSLSTEILKREKNPEIEGKK